MRVTIGPVAGLSAMLAGMPSDVATVLDYKEEDLGAIFEKFFN